MKKTVRKLVPERDEIEEKLREGEKDVFSGAKGKEHKHRDFWEGILREERDVGEEIDEKHDGKDGEKESERKGERDELFLRDEEDELGLRRSKRIRNKRGYSVSTGSKDPGPDDKPPGNLNKARKGPYWEGFERAIETEITQLEKNHTWEYVDIKSIEKGANILRSKFVFDIKRDEKGNFLKYKARFVACGNGQVEGIDFFDTSTLKFFLLSLFSHTLLFDVRILSRLKVHLRMLVLHPNVA